LFVTHDLSLGNYVSDRTIILRHGAIVEMGATPKVFGNPCGHRIGHDRMTKPSSRVAG
jgi:ABC-type oligopeptide transport system ATPase subunit